MWVYDVATLSFLEVNDAAVAHYGYSRDEFLAMRLTDLSPSDADRALLEATVAESVAATGPTGRQQTGTWRQRLKDGRIREFDVVTHVIEFGGRRASMIVAIDATDLKHAQISLTKYPSG
jgi:PAS domain S-box-containing protein